MWVCKRGSHDGYPVTVSCFFGGWQLRGSVRRRARWRSWAVRITSVMVLSRKDVELIFYDATIKFAKEGIGFISQHPL
jgi:hypothetical protein